MLKLTPAFLKVKSKHYIYTDIFDTFLFIHSFIFVAHLFLFRSIYYVNYQAVGERSVRGVGVIQWKDVQKYIQQVVQLFTKG